MILAGVFYLSLAMLGYVYAGYPLLVWLLARLRPHPVAAAAVEPRVSLLIAAYNEADVIAATLDNKLALDYPADKLEIFVVSDASSDATEAIVAEFADRGVRLLRQPERAGKTAALNRAAAMATGDLLVFSDANSLYDSDALRQLAAVFADPQVGYATGQMSYVDETGSPVGSGCSAYMRYENFLRRQESLLGSVVGVDGGIDAMRRDLFRAMNPDQLPDFVLPLSVITQGSRVVYVPGARLCEASLQQGGDEYRMRVRVALRSLWALFDFRGLLTFRRQPLYAWQLWSHKLLRYLCFLALATLFVSSWPLAATGPGYRLLLLLQLAGLVAAAAAQVLGRRVRLPILNLPYYFLLVNLAAGQAFWQFIRGQKRVLWTPRRG